MLLAAAVAVLAVGMRLKTLRQIPEAAWFGTENERVAAALAQGRGFAEAFGPGTPPTAHLAPLYPLLLSGLYRLCGSYQTLSGRMTQQALSITLATLVLLLLPATVRKLGLSAAAGWTAALLAACLPANLWDEVTGHHDQVAGSLILLGLLWVLDDLRLSGWSGRGPVARAGLLLGMAALLCPNLLPVAGLFFAVEWLRGPGERKRILHCGLIVSAMVSLFLLPWVVRNYRVLGGFVPLRSNLGLELAVGNRPGADGHTYAWGFGEVHPFGSAAERERLREMGELAYVQDKQRQALTWIAAHPARFARLTLRRAGLIWFSSDERWYQLEPKLRLSIRIYGLMGILALLELARLLWRGKAAGRLLACAALGVSLPYCLTHVENRYRLPLVGLFALLSCNLIAAALVWIAAKRTSLPGPSPTVDATTRDRCNARRSFDASPCSE
jgi:hypothetical protein